MSNRTANGSDIKREAMRDARRAHGDRALEIITEARRRNGVILTEENASEIGLAPVEIGPDTVVTYDYDLLSQAERTQLGVELNL